MLELKASSNVISNLPGSLVNCCNLTKIDFEGNRLEALPEIMIQSWSSLTELRCPKNLLTSIPKNIGSLPRLISLDLHQNRISSVPQSIGCCSSLSEIYLGENTLFALPPEVGKLSKLGILDLHSNQLKEFPVQACSMNLSMLDLSNNSLTLLPPELGRMISLRKLLVTGNPIRTLRSSLCSGPTPALLKFLRSRLSSGEDEEDSRTRQQDLVLSASRMALSSKELSLKGLGLSSFPSNITDLNEIVSIDLSDNSFEDIPHQICSSGSLQVLILSKNKMKEWPSAALESLGGLRCLMLDCNPLGLVPPDCFRPLSNLQTLKLSGGSSLPPAAAFSGLPNLRQLYLSSMKIRVVPCGILNLKSLEVLDLSQNCLEYVPEEIQNLTALVELDLSNNNITGLPPQLGLLEMTLQVLRLDGNPLRSIRRAIVAQGTKAVLKYLRGKLPE